MDEEHRGGVQVETELRHQHGGVIVAAGRVIIVYSVRQRISRVDTYAPLHLAGDLVYLVYGVVALVAGGCDPHEGEMASGR